MTGAIALAVVLVIAVAGLSLAMQNQRALQNPNYTRPQRPSRPQATPRIRQRRHPAETPTQEPVAKPDDSFPTDPEPKLPELLRTGIPAEARVISVVDERTIGPVTRSRLTLEIKPVDGDSFEVTIRHAFPAPEARSKVKVGGTVPVRYDPDTRNRVVIDLPAD